MSAYDHSRGNSVIQHDDGSVSFQGSFLIPQASDDNDYDSDSDLESDEEDVQLSPRSVMRMSRQLARQSAYHGQMQNSRMSHMSRGGQSQHSHRQSHFSQQPRMSSRQSQFTRRQQSSAHGSQFGGRSAAGLIEEEETFFEDEEDMPGQLFIQPAPADVFGVNGRKRAFFLSPKCFCLLFVLLFAAVGGGLFVFFNIKEEAPVDEAQSTTTEKPVSAPKEVKAAVEGESKEAEAEKSSCCKPSCCCCLGWSLCTYALSNAAWAATMTYGGLKEDGAAKKDASKWTGFLAKTKDSAEYVDECECGGVDFCMTFTLLSQLMAEGALSCNHGCGLLDYTPLAKDTCGASEWCYSGPWMASAGSVTGCGKNCGCLEDAGDDGDDDVTVAGV